MKHQVASLSPSVSPPSRPLGQAGTKLWHSIMAEYGITDSGGVELLLLAAEATDRATTLRAAIEADGVVLRLTNGAVREHPALKAELAAMAFVARTLARLGLNFEPVQRVGRPSSLTSVGWRQHGD